MRDPLFDSLAVLYQPIVRLSDGSLRGFEALARWPSSEAARFSAPREPEVLSALSRRVLEAAAGALAGWCLLPEARDLVLNVNLPGLDLYSPGLVERVADTLARHSIAPFALRLEVTEHEKLPDLGKAREIIEALAAAGVGVGIDDFGAGATSLMWLLELPVQCVKLDRDLVQAVHRGPRGISIVRHILALLGELKLETVAEGLEHAHTAQALQDMGCMSGQGYLYAPPLPIEAARALIARQGLPQWTFYAP